MRRTGLPAALTAAFALVAAGVPAPSPAQESPAHAFCRMTEGPSGARFERCVSAQIDAATLIARRLAEVRARPDIAEALVSAYDECRGLWSPDFDRIAACLEDRLEGR